MDKVDHEVFVRLNGAFDKALMELHDCHAEEVRDLRKLYFKARQENKALRKEIQKLKGEADGVQDKLRRDMREMREASQS